MCVNGWIKGKPHTLTPEEYGGFKNVKKLPSLGCMLCGAKFKAGDAIRWVYSNDKGSTWKYGNFFVCGGCDTGDNRELQRKAVGMLPNQIMRQAL